MSADNYTITMSSDAWLSTVAAVLTSLRDDRRELDRMPLMPCWAEWINSEIALKSEAIQALNLAKVVTDDPAHKTVYMDNMVDRLEGMPPPMFLTLCNELHFLRHVFALGGNVSKSSLRVDCLDEILLFLESPK